MRTFHLLFVWKLIRAIISADLDCLDLSLVMWNQPSRNYSAMISFEGIFLSSSAGADFTDTSVEHLDRLTDRTWIANLDLGGWEGKQFFELTPNCMALLWRGRTFGEKFRARPPNMALIRVIRNFHHRKEPVRGHWNHCERGKLADISNRPKKFSIRDQCITLEEIGHTWETKGEILAINGFWFKRRHEKILSYFRDYLIGLFCQTLSLASIIHFCQGIEPYFFQFYFLKLSFYQQFWLVFSTLSLFSV